MWKDSTPNVANPIMVIAVKPEYSQKGSGSESLCGRSAAPWV
ncbi:Uncharacterised protein [Mycobacteroides abscessus subsp. abscessus]|nr:Uncharacterised protein [Mycobacteroides abscessus subsp. abscessus]